MQSTVPPEQLCLMAGRLYTYTLYWWQYVLALTETVHVTTFVITVSMTVLQRTLPNLTEELWEK